jgi:hypothetical protein
MLVVLCGTHWNVIIMDSEKRLSVENVMVSDPFFVTEARLGSRQSYIDIGEPLKHIIVVDGSGRYSAARANRLIKRLAGPLCTEVPW